MKTSSRKDSIPWIYGRDMKDYKYYDTLSAGPLYYNKDLKIALKKK
jgi:hypothetical protein